MQYIETEITLKEYNRWVNMQKGEAWETFKTEFLDAHYKTQKESLELGYGIYGLNIYQKGEKPYVLMHIGSSCD